MEKGLIQASNSPYGTAVFVVTKKNGSLCFITNYWALNKVNIKNRYNLPLINELFNSSFSSQHFSKINLSSGYKQIRMKEEEILKTAFFTKHESFECVIVKFMMNKAPSTFLTDMNEVFFFKKNRKIRPSVTKQYHCLQPKKVTTQ